MRRYFKSLPFIFLWVMGIYTRTVLYDIYEVARDFYARTGLDASSSTWEFFLASTECIVIMF